MSVLLAVATYVLYLSARGDLDLYIHPRYIVFTTVLAAIGLIVLLIDSHYSPSAESDKHAHSSSKILFVPLLFLLVSALVLPARTLSSSTVSQRTADTGSIIATSESRPVSTLFAGSSRGLRLADWSRLIVTNDDPSAYINKPAKISGFVYDAGLGDDTVWLARFVLTCCAVDAHPVGVPVQLTDWRGSYSEDEWVEVEGMFSVQPTTQGEQLVLVPESAQKINQPSNPYAN